MQEKRASDATYLGGGSGSVSIERYNWGKMRLRKKETYF